MISENKIDNTFPTGQFKYSRPIRLDRNCHGGEIMKDDLPCHELSSHKLPINIECTFLEMAIRKTKWLIVGGYNPPKENISYCLKHVSRELDKYLLKYEICCYWVTGTLL